MVCGAPKSERSQPAALQGRDEMAPSTSFADVSDDAEVREPQTWLSNKPNTLPWIRDPQRIQVYGGVRAGHASSNVLARLVVGRQSLKRSSLVA